jgi:hypothetical protein
MEGHPDENRHSELRPLLAANGDALKQDACIELDPRRNIM